MSMFLRPAWTKWPTPIPSPSPSPPIAMTSRSGFESFAPCAKGRTLPCSVCTPVAFVKWTILPEQPIPEKRTSLFMSMGSSVSAIFSPASMPKSPQPGHQSLWTSVRRSESLSAMGQHHSLVLCRGLDYPFDALVDLVLGHRSPIVLYDLVLCVYHCLLRNDLGHLARIVLLHIDWEFGI